MVHEVSETVKRNGRWVVIDTVGKNKGKVNGPKEGFDTSKIADSYARQSSENYSRLSDRNRGER